METEHVRERAVGLREQAHDVERLPPVRTAAAEFARNAQREQAALAQGIPLGLGRAAALVALDGGRREALHQVAGNVARRFGNRNGKN